MSYSPSRLLAYLFASLASPELNLLYAIDLEWWLIASIQR